ncbi:MAG: hypothetical protein EA411_10275 [Saprospirales bacterium]|nr:MAG: hypothetical protein EA411_10275 [Saprospirales bacterium]
MGSEEFDRIEAFIDGKLSDDELKEFMERLEVDEKLREKLEAHKAARLVAESLAEHDLRNRMKKWKAQNTGTSDKEAKGAGPKQGVVRRMISYGIAASLLAFVVGVSYLYVDSPRHASNVFAERNTGEYTLTERGTEQDMPIDLREIHQLYAAGEWESVIEASRQYQPISTDEKMTLNFLLADSKYRIGNIGAALDQYNNILETADDRWHIDRAEWKKVLIQLESEPFNQDYQIELDRIAEDTTHLYQKAAQGLKSEMRGLRFTFGRLFI